MQIVGPKLKLGRIKRIVGEPTPDGTPITWSNPIRFEGILSLLSGREILEYQQVNVLVNYKLLTNYLSIKEEDKITYKGKEYDVNLIDNAFLMDKILVVLLSAEK